MPYATEYTQDPNCRICGVPYAGHPRCASCSIFCGPGHFQELSPYRGKSLCGLCIEAWKRLEEDVGDNVLWHMFLKMDSFYQGDGTLYFKAARR